ncbi:MAG: radical SAM protein [Deltaproteobacteria bacterium]|nr:radical SAM protein [Deltaproteobacteria bacterium]
MTSRGRRLPIAPKAPPGPRGLPLADEVRESDRQARPILAVWELTLACDLACRHCGSRAGRAREDELSTDECLDVVDQLAELGVFEVALIGGEAYLRDDWCQIIEHIKARGMSPILTTGGRGITAELARAAAKAGLDSASISIDGIGETHDYQRAVKGSYQAALQAMRHFDAAGVGVSANTQINRLSKPELPQILETIIDHNAHSWQLQLTVAMGRAADEPELLLQPFDLLEVFPVIGRLAERCAEADVLLWPGNNLGYFGPFETTLRGSTPRGHMGHCAAGRSGLGIEADGTIKGCPSLATSNWAGGNLREHSLVDIWERSPAFRYTRDRHTEDLWGFCKTCYYAEVCRAGCTWTSESLLGKPGNNPMCHHRALEMQAAGKRERLVKVEEAPGQPFDMGRFELVVEDLDPSTSSE